MPRPHRSTALAIACLLAACQPAPAPVATPPAPAEPAAPVEPATPLPPPTSTIDGDRDLARWDGYDAMRFGMDEAAVRAAWGAPLKGDPPMEGSSCRHLYRADAAVPADFALMFEDGRFVRYSVEDDALLAPGGGRVGMAAADIERLYPGRVESRPHAYVVGGRYLRITEGDHVLVFATGADGRVAEWRVGRMPQVDYVEGCN